MKEESEKAGLKLNIQKTKIAASSRITSWQTDGETETIFLGSEITADGDYSYEIKRRLLVERKVMTNLKAKTLLCQVRSTYSKIWFFQ